MGTETRKCEVKGIKVTVLLPLGGEFSAIFDDAASAFVATYNYLISDPRDCYYKGNYDKLMKLMLEISEGRTTESKCSMFRAYAILG